MKNLNFGFGFGFFLFWFGWLFVCFSSQKYIISGREQ